MTNLPEQLTIDPKPWWEVILDMLNWLGATPRLVLGICITLLAWWMIIKTIRVRKGN